MLVNADLKRTLANQVATDRAQMERAVRTFFHPRPETPRPRARLFPSAAHEVRPINRLVTDQ
jgi:7-keto-8-aminopelargonate synthetase-like enzyme